jgi:hypothetical protein
MGPLIALGTDLLLMCITASKMGSGFYHLMAFVPSYRRTPGVAWQWPEVKRKKLFSNTVVRLRVAFNDNVALPGWDCPGTLPAQGTY